MSEDNDRIYREALERFETMGERNMSEQRKALAAFGAGLAFGAALTAAVLLAGCPIRVDPTTDEVCPTLPNCGRCVSDTNCAWSPSERDCFARSVAPSDSVRSLVERCPEDERGERAPETSGP